MKTPTPGRTTVLTLNIKHYISFSHIKYAHKQMCERNIIERNMFSITIWNEVGMTQTCKTPEIYCYSGF